MSDEIKAAAERWRAYRYDSDLKPVDASWAEARDARTLADAYIADVAQREREQAERALPIDEAWLMSIGFSSELHAGVAFMRLASKWHEVQVILDGPVYIRSMKVPSNFVRLGNMETTTRGMLLDLLSALQINTKGEA